MHYSSFVFSDNFLCVCYLPCTSILVVYFMFWINVYDLLAQGMGKWELWTEEIKDAPPIPKVFMIRFIHSFCPFSSVFLGRIWFLLKRVFQG